MLFWKLIKYIIISIKVYTVYTIINIINVVVILGFMFINRSEYVTWIKDDFTLKMNFSVLFSVFFSSFEWIHRKKSYWVFATNRVIFFFKHSRETLYIYFIRPIWLAI